MRHSNIVTGASLSTRVHQWWITVPFVTAAIVGLCSIIYAVDLFTGYHSFFHVCMLPSRIVGNFEVYRIFSSVVFHASIFHVVFNMLALVPIGSGLERIMGSIRYLHVLLLLAISNGVIQTGLAFLVAHNPIYVYRKAYEGECQVGFSGILFSMIVMETSLSGIQTRSVFGIVTVPSKLYAWTLLILFQLLMPNVSLMGHLCGILNGFAYVCGLFNVLLLSPSTYSAIESSNVLAYFVRRPSFILGGSASSGSLNSPATQSNGFPGIRIAWSRIQSFLLTRGPPADERFPGRGWVLRSPSIIPPIRPGSHFNPESRHSNNNQTTLQTRLLDRSTLNSSTTDLQQVVASPPTNRPVGGGQLNSQHTGPQAQIQTSGAESDSLQNLVAMGFEKAKAVRAMTAANGDIALAVEFLSAEGN